MAAAIEAARAGANVTVIEENERPGGQLFKQIHKFFGSGVHQAGTRGVQIGLNLLNEAEQAGVEIRLDTVVYGIFSDKRLGLVCGDHTEELAASVIILATGANENALAFPGWTLPGVMGAGAAQTLINIHRVLPGHRVLMVGAGNVGLIVAYQLLQAGIEVAAVAEATDAVGGYMVHAAKIRRMGVPLFLRHTVLSAEGDGRVERCTIAEVDEGFQPVAGTERVFEADLVCLSVGLSPAIELCGPLGAAVAHVRELGGWVPLHDRHLRTSVDGVYVAGDASGIEEASTAMEEGRLAAVAAARSLGRLTEPRARELSSEALQGLADLRRGPFGEAVGHTKEELYRRYEEECLTSGSST